MSWWSMHGYTLAVYAVNTLYITLPLLINDIFLFDKIYFINIRKPQLRGIKAI